MSPALDEKSPYKPFQADGVEPKYPRDRGFAVLHTGLDITLDDRKKEVRGRATLRVRAIHPIQRVELDAADMKIRRVTAAGKPLRFEHDEPSLVVHLASRLKEHGLVELSIEYEGRPTKGLYFITPDRHYPDKPVQIWSQGESEDNHHWFPGYDYPNNKATSEARLTVRKPLVAFSNGHLVGSSGRGGWSTFHWRQEVAQPNYLIAVVVGEFDEVKDAWEKVPLQYFVPKGQRAWATETFKHTGDVLAFFSKATGYRYPYPKYAQAVIADFMWGGMENTSMTTVNEKFLILPEHRDDADPDGLIAHEAAHQWFGDLVTTKSWDHIWLNEGFATYFDALWHEHFHGQDMFQLELVENADAYFAEDRESYRRPIVTRVYAENEDLFDRHTYQKGSLVLHMLRHELGDDLWWKTIRHYLKKFEWKNVETADFKIAIEEATGRNLDWFFDQWLHKAGHPELEARWDQDEKSRMVKLTLKQTQKVVGETPLFRIPLDVWVWNGTDRKEHRITFTKGEESFFLPSAKKPDLVQVDPHGVILKKLNFERSAKEWAVQLERSPDVAARVEACRALGKKASDAGATSALARALQKDTFWGVRRAAAQALGEQATQSARDALAAAAKDPHPRVRRGVARALGNFKHDATAVKLLQTMLRNERKSDYVVAAALFGLAQTKDPSAFDTLKRHLTRTSHNEIIRTSIFAAFGELKDARALPIAIDHTRYGTHAFVRSAATMCLGRLWDFVDRTQKEDIRDALGLLMKDAAHPERRSAYVAAGDTPDGHLVNVLLKQIESEPIGLLKKVARDSLRHVQDKLGDQAQISDLRRSFEELHAEHRKLQTRLAEVEARIKSGGKRK